MIRRVLLAVDRSGHAEQGTRVTADLAAAPPAELRVLHVHEAPITASVYRPDELERAAVETAEAAAAPVDRTVGRLCERGVAASGSVRLAAGATVAQIVATAGEDDADLLVVGALGASRWRELAVGCVAHDVVQLAPCPVLVVPRRTVPGDLRRVVLAVDGSAGAARDAELTSDARAGVRSTSAAISSAAVSACSSARNACLTGGRRPRRRRRPQGGPGRGAWPGRWRC